MPAYVLYGGRFTRSLLVEMVLAEGEIDYELREVDIFRQEHLSSGFLAINPAGWVPAMITPEGQILYETPAINLYLAERHGLTQLTPRVDEADRGLFLSGLFYITNDIEPALKRYFYPHRFVVRSGDAPIMKRRSLKAVIERFSVIDKRLRKNGPYHLGRRFSLVDLTMTYWAADMGSTNDLDALPALRECMTLVMERPRLRDCFARMETLRAELARTQADGSGDH